MDLDCFGSPWSFLLAWIESDRERAPVTRVFLTDGYMSHVGFSAADKTLFPGRGKDCAAMQPGEYLQTVDARLREWGARASLEVVRRRTIADKNMRLHYLEATRPS